MSEQKSASAPSFFATISSAMRFVVGFLIVAVASTITMAIALLLLPWRILRIKLCNYYGKIIGYTIVRIAGVNPVLRSMERINQKHPAIYVANHASTLDAFLSIWMCPIGGSGVMKKQVYKIPFFGQLYMLSGHLALNREDKSKAIAGIEDIVQVVKKHRISIWIMPEGTRSRDGRLLPFKLGFVHIALATGLPIVPVIIHGAHKTWVKGTNYVEPTAIEIDVLDPIPTTNWTADTARKHAEDVHRVFVEHLRDDQKPLAPAPVLAEKAA
ncbi:MAG TPA: lysophospholipid acyltransferase family protein [Polyangium sp.]|nr:lysophospholipid acyltransferase family protein [Polyangium sp.]